MKYIVHKDKLFQITEHKEFGDDIYVKSLSGNVLQLGEVADFERQIFDLAQMFIRNPKLDLSTEPAIFYTRCYA